MSWVISFTATTKEIAKREIQKSAASAGDSMPKGIVDEMLKSVDLVNLDPNPPRLPKSCVQVTGNGHHHGSSSGGSGRGTHAFEVKAIPAPISE